MSRDTIIGLLWPESGGEHGRNSLSQVLSLLRRELAADDLVTGTAELRLNANVLECDVIEFEQRIAAGDLEGATRAYAGPFLDGVFLKNTPEFERWVAQERSRLQNIQADALEQLATGATAKCDHVSAARFWRQRVGLVPTDSRAARAFMESLVASGDSAGALAHYRVHVELLLDELSLEPDPKLVEFAAVIRHGTTQPVNAIPAARQIATAADTIPEQPKPIREADAVATSTRRRWAAIPMALIGVAILVVAITWGAESGRFTRDPAPPAYDSLRLRVVTMPAHSGPSDSTLAQEVREAVLAEMARDPWLFVVTPTAFVRQAPLIGLDQAVLGIPDTTRKYARKMRTHAIVELSVSRAVNGYVLTAEARSASTDSSLGVIAEVAKGDEELPAAMARLGHDLRKRLVTARATLPPTKWSLNTTDNPPAAIELYLEARSEADRRNYIEAARRGEAAVQVDSTFAQAWRIVNTSLYNAGLSVDGQLKAISAAFRFSNRVRAPFWRLDIISAYYRSIGDYDRALVFYDSIGVIAPLYTGNAGLAYLPLRKYDLAVRSYRSVVDATHRRSISSAGPMLVSSLLDAGRLSEARQEVAEMMRLDSLSPWTVQGRAYLFSALKEWDSLDTLERSNLRTKRTATDSAQGVRWLGDAAIGRGQFELFDKMTRLNAMVIEKHGSLGDYLAAELLRARLRATLTGDTARARAIADSGFAVAHWDSLKPMDRPYLSMLLYLASVGEVTRGADVVREWSVATPVLYKGRDSLNILVGRGELALASGNGREALRLFKIADVGGCERCFYPRYGRAFDAINKPDSARIWYERFADAAVVLDAVDHAELPNAYFRLGELSDQRHDSSAAIRWYDRFAALLATADAPSLQAKVRDVRGRAARLRKQ